MGENKGKQFDISKRKILFNALVEEKTATEIATLLGVNKTTISREVYKYRYLSFKGDDNPSICSTCRYSLTCVLKHKCGYMLCSSKCVGCKSLKTCDRYKEIECNKLNRFPFICLNCPYIDTCKRNHYSYDPIIANQNALEIRSSSRTGINMSEEQYRAFDKTILEGNRQGQSLYHIQRSNDLGRSLKSIYNYSHKGQISVRPIDLPRMVTLKERKTKTPSQYEYNENKEIDRSHHMYSDWLIYQAKKRIIVYWEMDFLGAPHKSEQMIMVLIIPQFQFVYLIPFNNPKQQDVLDSFNNLDNKLGDDFEKLFEAIITDRDPRFNSFREIEARDDGTIRTRIFFCNPGASNEKPFVENVNQQLRTIFPKGFILSDITLEQCNEISSNFNSRYLNSIDGKRPVDLFIEYFGEKLLHKLGLKVIEPKDIRIIRFDKY